MSLTIADNGIHNVFAKITDDTFEGNRMPGEKQPRYRHNWDFTGIPSNKNNLHQTRSGSNSAIYHASIKYPAYAESVIKGESA